MAAASSSGLERNASFFFSESSGKRLPEGEGEFVTRICLEHFVQYDDFYLCAFVCVVLLHSSFQQVG